MRRDEDDWACKSRVASMVIIRRFILGSKIQRQLTHNELHPHFVVLTPQQDDGKTCRANPQSTIYLVHDICIFFLVLELTVLRSWWFEAPAFAQIHVQIYKSYEIEYHIRIHISRNFDLILDLPHSHGRLVWHEPGVLVVLVAPHVPTTILRTQVRGPVYLLLGGWVSGIGMLVGMVVSTPKPPGIVGADTSLRHAIVLNDLHDVAAADLAVKGLRQVQDRLMKGCLLFRCQQGRTIDRERMQDHPTAVVVRNASTFLWQPVCCSAIRVVAQQAAIIISL